MQRILHKALYFAVFFTLANQCVWADELLTAAIAGSQRSVANKSRDAARHPLETLQFFGITPTMRVVELMPGAGWYTEILAPYLAPQGQLIAALQDPASESDYGRTSFSRFKQKLSAKPEVYGKVTTSIFEPPLKLKFAPDNSVDMVLTFRNIHNWVGDGDANMKQLFQQIYLSLKPGGILGVVEHRLPPNKVQDAKASTGYVSEAYVIQLAQSVGFKLVAKSEINANPKDTADHPGGVWALPPTYTNKELDTQTYTDIGESDRMTLKLIK